MDLRLKRFRWMVLILLNLLGWFVLLQHRLGTTSTPFTTDGVAEALTGLRPSVSESPLETLVGISLGMPLAAPVFLFHSSARLSAVLIFPNSIVWAVAVEVILRRYIDREFDRE